MTQEEQVLTYIREHGSIDPLRAVTELHIFRLSARIFDLRMKGIDIYTVTVTRRYEDGTVKSWAEYRLKKPLPDVSDQGTAQGGEVEDSVSTPNDNTKS